METADHQVPKRRQWPPFLAFIVTYIASRVVFAVFGFHYSPFSDHFDAGKLLVDLGVWSAMYISALWGLNRLMSR